MGLKQDIVIVNEFSVPTPSGGTRGSTPGDYVMRYMARSAAVEDMAPVRLSEHDDFIVRYMSRVSATEKVQAKVKKGEQGSARSLGHKLHTLEGLGGIAFGRSGRHDAPELSLSDTQVRNFSKSIQRGFDHGKTVLKTVISFSEDYLRKNGIIDPDFHPEHPGDYRGNIDQLKLRQAICDGMDKLGRKYDNLQWVGVIQVDTMHVHAHLCMVDQGTGTLAGDGSQKGKLNTNHKRLLRRGIDESLDELHAVRHLATSISHKQRNIRTFVKKFTHELMGDNEAGQFLLACLPEDKRLWRAGTNNKQMRKANAVVRHYVEQTLANSDSGFDEALEKVSMYARTRVEREQLGAADYRRLCNVGRERIITDAMNGVYQVLKEVDPHKLTIKTPMLDVMSRPVDQVLLLRQSDPMVEFGFKLRSYHSRLEHHKKQRAHFHKLNADFDTFKRDYADDAHLVKQFYETEEEYNDLVLSKYQHFLAFLPIMEQFDEQLEALSAWRTKLEAQQKFMMDARVAQMSQSKAEEYGKQIYGFNGGGQYVTHRDEFVLRHRLNTQSLDRQWRQFEFVLQEHGLKVDEGALVKHERHDFHAVKALDLHHLTYDFPYDVPMSKINVDAFVDMANRRAVSLAGASMFYASRQIMDGEDRAVAKDILAMKQLADSLVSTADPKLPSSTAGTQEFRRSKTVSLDERMGQMLRAHIIDNVSHVDESIITKDDGLE